MRFKHTNRPGFWFGLIDFCTAGLFFLFYIPLSGLQDELDYIVERRTQRYWVAYLLGIPTLFIYPLVWMARIAGELKAKAVEMGIEGPHTSWWHMFGWNTIGVLFFGAPIATSPLTRNNGVLSAIRNYSRKNLSQSLSQKLCNLSHV